MWKSLRGFSGVICWMVDFVKAVNVWVRNTFGNVYIVLVAIDDKKILEGRSEICDLKSQNENREKVEAINVG